MKENQQLMLFSASWCPTCQPVKKLLENSDIQNVIFVDVDVSSNLSSKYGIRSIPTMILLEDDKEVKRHLGSCSTVQLEELLS